MYMFCKHCKKESGGQYPQYWCIRIFGLTIFVGQKGNRCPFCGKRNKKPCLYEKTNGGSPKLFSCNGAAVPRDLYKGLFEEMNKTVFDKKCESEFSLPNITGRVK